MEIVVVGSGYVGLCTAVGFASFGNNVTCVDVDREKVNKINAVQVPIYEKTLEEMLSEALRKKLLSATSDINDIKSSDFIFIAVGTPSKNDGSIDLKYIEKASKDIADFIKYKSQDFNVLKSETSQTLGGLQKTDFFLNFLFWLMF